MPGSMAWISVVTSELGTSISLDPDAPDRSPRFLMISARVHPILDKPQDEMLTDIGFAIVLDRAFPRELVAKVDR